MPHFVRYLLTGAVVVALQFLVFGRLQIWGAYPDAVLLFVAWLGLRFGRNTGAGGGFVLGLVMDALYGTWGIQAFTKTLVGFLVGLFPANERETLLILPSQAFIGSFVVSLLHNGIMVLFLVVQTGVRSMYMVTILWLAAALYTAVLAIVASLFASR